MNTQKFNKAIVIVWMALALSFGTGIVATGLGFEGVTTSYASGGANCGGGGGCAS